MKKNLFILWLFVLFVAFTGCNSEGGLPPYNYTLRLNFENELGDNLVKDLKYDPSTESSIIDGNRFLVSRKEYKQSMEGKYSLEKDVPLEVDIMDNGDASLIVQNATFDHVTPTITHRLICPKIFGDDKEHVIVSYWERTPKYVSICVKITCDNEEFPVKEVAYAYEAKIKIQKP